MSINIKCCFISYISPLLSKNEQKNNALIGVYKYIHITLNVTFQEALHLQWYSFNYNSRGGENRTPTKGFGDPYDTTSPHP